MPGSPPAVRWLLGKHRRAFGQRIAFNEFFPDHVTVVFPDFRERAEGLGVITTRFRHVPGDLSSVPFTQVGGEVQEPPRGRVKRDCKSGAVVLGNLCKRTITGDDGPQVQMDAEAIHLANEVYGEKRKG